MKKWMAIVGVVLMALPYSTAKAQGPWTPESVNTSSVPYVLKYPIDFAAPGMTTNLPAGFSNSMPAYIVTNNETSVNLGVGLTVGGNPVLTNSTGATNAQYVSGTTISYNTTNRTLSLGTNNFGGGGGWGGMSAADSNRFANFGNLTNLPGTWDVF